MVALIVPAAITPVRADRGSIHDGADDQHCRNQPHAARHEPISFAPDWWDGRRRFRRRRCGVDRVFHARMLAEAAPRVRMLPHTTKSFSSQGNKPHG